MTNRPTAGTPMTVPLRHLLLLFMCLKPISCAAAKSPPRVPNIDFVGYGYASLFGCPLSQGIDLGFRQSVLALGYSTGTTSDDGKWSIPDRTDVTFQPPDACSLNPTISLIQGHASFLDAMSTDAVFGGNKGGDGSSFDGRFGESVEFANVYKDVYLFHRAYVLSVAKCFVYEAKLRETDGPVTSAFADMVEQLPVDGADRTKYRLLVSTFGTHVVTGVRMGAKAMLMSSFEQRNWTTLISAGFDFSKAADVSFRAALGDASAATNSNERTLMEIFEARRRSVSENFIGVETPENGNATVWNEEASKMPLPIVYTMRPLTDLFTSATFTDEDPLDLATKRANLAETIAKFAVDVPQPTVLPDRPAVSLVAAEVEIPGGLQTISCKPGYTLLSCGISSRLLSADAAPRGAAPVTVGNSTCQCSAGAVGGRCYAWCANSVEKFQIVVSNFQLMTFSVSCPRGSKVASCSISRQSNTPADNRKSFPKPDGSGCVCHDYTGASCRATCLSNVRNHEIRSVSGRGILTASCSPDNFVLGCGLAPGLNATDAAWTADGPTEFRVASLGSCMCYGAYNSTCYAICANFL